MSWRTRFGAFLVSWIVIIANVLISSIDGTHGGMEGARPIKNLRTEDIKQTSQGWSGVEGGLDGLPD